MTTRKIDLQVTWPSGRIDMYQLVCRSGDDWWSLCRLVHVEEIAAKPSDLCRLFQTAQEIELSQRIGEVYGFKAMSRSDGWFYWYNIPTMQVGAVNPRTFRQVLKAIDEWIDQIPVLHTTTGAPPPPVKEEPPPPPPCPPSYYGLSETAEKEFSASEYYGSKRDFDPRILRALVGPF